MISQGGIPNLGTAVACLCRRKSAAIMALCIRQWDKGNATKEAYGQEKRRGNAVVGTQPEIGVTNLKSSL